MHCVNIRFAVVRRVCVKRKRGSGMMWIEIKQVGALRADKIMGRRRSATTQKVSMKPITERWGTYPAIPTDCGI